MIPYISLKIQQTYSCPRDCSSSLHHEHPIEGSLKPLGPSQYFRNEEFKAGPHFAETRYSLTNTGCNLPQSKASRDKSFVFLRT